MSNTLLGIAAVGAVAVGGVLGYEYLTKGSSAVTSGKLGSATFAASGNNFTIGESATLSVLTDDTTGAALPGVACQLQVSTNGGTTFTNIGAPVTSDSTGEATGSYPFSAAGSYLFQVVCTYNGVTLTSNQVSVTVTAATETITISPVGSTTIQSGGTITANGTVTAGGQPVSGDAMSQYVDTGTAGTSAGTTSADGTFSFSRTFTTVGTHTWYVSDSTGTKSNSITVTVQAAAPTLGSVTLSVS